MIKFLSEISIEFQMFLIVAAFGLIVLIHKYLKKKTNLGLANGISIGIALGVIGYFVYQVVTNLLAA